MAKPMRPEWSNTQLIHTLRREENYEERVEGGPSTLNQNGRGKPMNKKIGLWLDRKKAVIVSIANNIEARTIITSGMENYVLYSTIVPGDGSPENIRDRRFWNHLGEYYDKIMEHLRGAEEILIFGPGDAKLELQKRLEGEGLAEHIVSLEDAGTLTNVQIAIRVRKRFPSRSQFDIF